MSETSNLTEQIVSTEDNFTFEFNENEVPIALEKSMLDSSLFYFPKDSLHPSAWIPTQENFFVLLERVMNAQQKLEGVAETDYLSLTDQNPLERADTFGNEVVSYKLISRTPANMSEDGKNRQQLGFNLSYSLRSAKYPDKVLHVERRPVDCIIELSCWSPKARIANSRVLWLERILVNNTWIFISHGYERFYWKERCIDTYYNVGGQPLHQRPLRFFVRMNEFRTKGATAISNINLKT